MFVKYRRYLLALSFGFLLSSCDNVLNRDAVVEYHGKTIGKTKNNTKQGVDVVACPDMSEFKTNINRLVTEQNIILAPNSHVILQQVVPIHGRTLYLDFYNQDGDFDASHLVLTICSANRVLETEKNIPEKLQFIDIKKFIISDDFGDSEKLSEGLKATVPLTGFEQQQLVLILSNTLYKAQNFNLDVRYAEQEQEPLPVLDKITLQSPAHGFLDLHLHQTGAMAFNNGWYWGGHEIGSLAERLPDCTGEHASMFEFEHVLDGKITGPLAYAIAPKNDVDDFMRAHRHMTQAKDYVRSDDRKHQQVAYERLKEAHERGLNLIISTVVENNILLDIMYTTGKGKKDWYPSVMESIHRQIMSLKALDEQSEWFEIVYDPWQARRVINEGKLAVVLGAEFTDIFPPSDGPWQQQLYDLYGLGLRHLQPVHKSDSQFSSTHDQGFPFDHLNLLRALIRKEIPNWPALQRTFGQSDPDIGMSPAGFELLDEMVRLHMIIDLSHASLSSQKQMTDYLLVDHNYYPFIYSHWSARSSELLDKLKQAGGMIAFGWGQPVPELKSYSEMGEHLACQDFVKERAELYQRYIAYGINFSLSSDMNGFAGTPEPNFGPKFCELNEAQKDRVDQTKTWERMQEIYPEHPEWVNRYWAQGAPDISLLPGIVYDLREILKLDTTKLENSTEDFIQMWERTYDVDRAVVN